MEGRSALHSQKPWLPLLVAIVLMTGLGGWIGWQWNAQEARLRAEQIQRFSLAINDIESTLRERMRAYEMVLRGLAGPFVGDREVSLEDWNRAGEQLQLQDFYPGVQAVALARYARAEELEGMLEKIVRGRSDFWLYPQGAREEYLVNDFVFPLDWRNRRVLGYDMLSEQTRREAILAARDVGMPMLTGPLRLKQGTEQDSQIGVILYLPVFRAGAPVTTVKERQAAFVGTVHASFRFTDLMEGVLGSRSRLFQVQLFDAAQPQSPLLVGRDPVRRDSALHRVVPFHLYGRNWQLEVASTPEYEAILSRLGRTFSLSAALTAALLFSLLVGGYLYLRERALANSRAAGAKLQEREERFRNLIEQLPVATLLCNPQGRIELANQSAANLLRSSVGLLAGERLSRYAPQALVEDAPDIRQQESQAVREDGTVIPVSLSRTSVRRDDGIHYLLNLVDLLPRKRAEERFRNVVEASPNAFFLFDPEGRILMVNRQTELMFGHDRKELIGQSVEMLIPDSMRSTYLQVRHRFMQTPASLRLGDNRELFGRHRDGHLVPVEVGLSPLRSGDELLVQAVVIDISHRKEAERRLRDQAEALMEVSRYKSEFLANMSHELRTPLNSILILSDQLRQNAAGNLSEKQVRHSDIIHRAGQDLLQLINDVLDLARIEAGSMQIRLEPLNLPALLSELSDELAPMAQRKGLTLNTLIDSEVPESIVSDHERLRQILRNLLTNALKFTEQGTVDVQVSYVAAGSNTDPGKLYIRVRDTGIGIATDQQERIFQAFQQIDGSISRQYGGTGLGLAIARQLSEVLGGGIKLESAPGQGSCFTVELPVHLTPSIAPSMPPPTLLRARQSVLIVDADTDFSGLVAEVGLSHGFTSRQCSTGREGLQALEQGRFAAVILDILLPDISGWQVYRMLRSDGRHQDVPVCIITSLAQPEGWGDEGTRYLSKPTEQAELERLFIELALRDENSERVLLVETDPARRRQIREHFTRHGYRVTECSCSQDARLAYAEQAFSVLLIDFDLADEDGLDLLDALHRLRPLNAVRVVLSSTNPLTDKQLERLQRYWSVALLKKQGLHDMEEAMNPPALEAVTPAGHERRSYGQLGQLVLLVVPDVRSVYLLTAMLDDQGLQVVPAGNAAEALRRFEENAFDLVLVDMALPDGGGSALIQQLRNDYGCQVPIVLLTADSEPATRQPGLAAGADDWLCKPVGKSELNALLQRCLESPDRP